MQDTMKTWMHHFECPHSRHEVWQEMHDMMHDASFGKVLTWVIIASVLATALAVILSVPPVEQPEPDWQIPWHQMVPMLSA
jgi:hypothetical protein